MMVRMAQNEKLAVLTAAMTDGTGLTDVARAFPDRFFDTGIAEEHAATFAAGLCAGGVHPVFAVYSTFLQRSYDSLIHDIGIQGLPVTLAIDRAGFNDADGVTHNGIFDVAFLSGIHGFSLWSPADYETLVSDLDAALDAPCPTAVRYPRGTETKNLTLQFDGNTQDTVRVLMPEQPTAVIVTYGTVCGEALIAKELLEKDGIRCGVVLVNRILPYSVSAPQIISAIPDSAVFICYLEEGIREGGAAMHWRNAVLDDTTEAGKHLGSLPSIVCAIDDPFFSGETGKTLRQSAGIDGETVSRRIKQHLLH